MTAPELPCRFPVAVAVARRNVMAGEVFSQIRCACTGHGIADAPPLHRSTTNLWLRRSGLRQPRRRDRRAVVDLRTAP